MVKMFKPENSEATCEEALHLQSTVAVLSKPSKNFQNPSHNRFANTTKKTTATQASPTKTLSHESKEPTPFRKSQQRSRREE